MSVLLTCCVLAALPAAARDEPEADRREIVAALEASGAAWSRGDLASFMRVYEASPDTAYVGGEDPVRGYDAIRSMYAARFGAGARSMGQLSFAILDCRALGTGYALVTGRYRLAREAAADAEGVFTLVFHKGASGWAIISDHTSS